MNQILDFGNEEKEKKKKENIAKDNTNPKVEYNNNKNNSNENSVNSGNNDNIVISPRVEPINNGNNGMENNNFNPNQMNQNGFDQMNSNYNPNMNSNMNQNLNDGNNRNNSVNSNNGFNSNQNMVNPNSSININGNGNGNDNVNTNTDNYRLNDTEDTYDSMEQFIPNIQKKKQGSGVGKKAVAIILIILAVVAAGVAIVVVRKNSEKSKNLAALKEKIQISIMEEENSTIALNISSINPVDKIVYSWNGKTDQEKQIDGKGRREISERGIEMPIGSNMIKVNVIDDQGNTQTAEKTFESRTGKDINKPEITITNKGAIIEVVVTDDVGLKEATSQMGNDKKAIYPAKKDEPGEIKFQVTAKEGTETLQVVAVDLAGNVTKEEREIKGVARPEVKVEQTSDTTKLIIKVKHNVGIAKVEYALNGQGYIKTYEENDPNNKEVELTQELAVGENTIKVKATSVEGFESNVFSSKATRTPGANASPFAVPSGNNMTNTNMQNPNYGTANMQYPNLTTQPTNQPNTQPNVQPNVQQNGQQGYTN